MSAKPPKQEESGPKVPAFIVTFSDMVTLLLTFFVMLLSLATVQDPEMFDKTRDAFIRNIDNIGLGMLPGRKSNPEFGRKMTKFEIVNPDTETDIRTIDADEERRKRIFQKMTQSMETLNSQIVADSTQYTIPRVQFSKSQSSLDAASKKYLDQFAKNLFQESQMKRTKLYILGMASDEKDLKNQWILSAQRAQEVAGYLRGVLPANGQYPVYAWGAGAGGNWVGESGYATKETQIMVAVLR
ncbi:MAG: hypothetical protein K9N55_21190 [Phycisphaerae bacterium]|nr:hypothetical protein [Phycisphaerae bacterium]